MRPMAPGGVHGRRLVVIDIAVARGHRQGHLLSSLGGDGGDPLARLRARGYQRGHAAQRRPLARQPLGHAPAILVETATRLAGLGTVTWPLGDQPVTCRDGHRIRLAHSSCSTVIGSDRMRRPVAWYAAFAMAADTPTTPISPMPLIPMGLTGSGVPTKTTSWPGTSANCSRASRAKGTAAVSSSTSSRTVLTQRRPAWALRSGSFRPGRAA